MGHFYFVRHGQTVWNVEGKICGATDIALTQLGHEQAIETGKKILEEHIQADEILYSPLMRAADTAKHYNATSPLSSTSSNPTDFTRFLRQTLHSAASSPVQILLSYSSYFLRSFTGDKLGITTFAPASSPFSLPFGSAVPRAVVAGSRHFGRMIRRTDNKNSVSSTLPAGSSANLVS